MSGRACSTLARARWLVSSFRSLLAREGRVRGAIAEKRKNPRALHDVQAHARLQEFGPLTPQSSLERPPTLPPLKLHALPPLTDLPEVRGGAGGRDSGLRAPGSCDHVHSYRALSGQLFDAVGLPQHGSRLRPCIRALRPAGATRRLPCDPPCCFPAPPHYHASSSFARRLSPAAWHAAHPHRRRDPAARLPARAPRPLWAVCGAGAAARRHPCLPALALRRRPRQH
mgnify:CR=1 FL=1